METFPFVTPSYPLIKIPEFSTNTITYGQKSEQRLSNWLTPRYRFQLNWGTLPTSEKQQILDFFVARKGSFEAFWFANPEEATNDQIWKPNTSYALDEKVRPITTNNRSYQCTTAGISGGSEPTWPTTAGGTVADGTMVWTENSYRVRFMQDEVNYAFFLYSLYSIQQVELQEVPE